MVIELLPIKVSGFPVLEHARFVGSVRTQVEGRYFTKATRREFDIEYPNLR